MGPFQKRIALLLTCLLLLAACSSESEKREDRTAFFEPPLEEQGVSGQEIPVFEQALQALLADPVVDFVATRKGDLYEVHAARGSVFFRRLRSERGTEYLVEKTEGENPIGRQDPAWIPTYEEELAAGSNPNGVAFPEEGYEPGDPRISFVEPQDDSYPYGYERIAAYFDHPDSADFIVNPKSYTHATGELGGHGSLGIVQSRCPLVFWGAGVRTGRQEGHPRQVDIAPTVARLLGLPEISGVDETGLWSQRVNLGWQDGHALEEILDGTTCRHALVLVCDGLAHTEFLHQIETRPGALSNLRRLVEEGAWYAYGSITNWPSVTYPSHNTIGSGVYSGHHGIVDNTYFLRSRGEIASPIGQLLLTEELFNPSGPAESLHQAVHRAFGSWDPTAATGAFTASLFDPSVKDADKADLEFRDRFYPGIRFPPLFLETPAGVPEPDPSLRHTASTLEQITEEVALYELYHLFTRQGGAARPRYVIVNFITTDGTGHANGPHGDDMKPVLDHIDATVGVLLAWLEAWGILQQTAIVLTSDHGMQIGDPTRSARPTRKLDEAGIPYRPGTGMGVYLLTP